MFVTNWISTTKIQKISEITNFFRHYFLSRTEVNLWTKTLLSGTQGFGTNSPEYGFWYRYFDVYNKRIGLSNMRFVSGSNGMNNGRYKAMPIRLVLK